LWARAKRPGLIDMGKPVVDATDLVLIPRVGPTLKTSSASKQPENVDVNCNEYAALPTIVQNLRIIEIAVQRAERVSSTDHGQVNNRVIIGIRRHDTGRWTGENNL